MNETIGNDKAARVVCIGAGPASLTVANDLLPLGYEVTVIGERRDYPVIEGLDSDGARALLGDDYDDFAG